MANKYINEELERQDARTIIAAEEMLARKTGGCLFRILKPLAGLVAVIFGFNFLGNLGESYMNDKKGGTKDSSIVQTEDDIKRENTEKITDALGESIGDTGETLMDIGGKIWDFGTDAFNYIGEKMEEHHDIEYAKDAAISCLKRLGLIEKLDNYEHKIYFSVEDFKTLNMSLRKISDIEAISQIYAFELAVNEYNPSAIDDYYRGIKCRYEDRYYEGKADFVKSIGCNDEFEYKSIAEGYIISKNGDISISSTNGIRLSNCSNNYSFKYNNEARGESLGDILNAKRQDQADNMKRAALGSYNARKYTR